MDEYLKEYRDLIVDKATTLAKGANSQTVGIRQVAKAIEELAGASPQPLVAPRRAHLLDIISPITLVSALLAIVFAAFGLWALSSANADKLGGGAYLDIAKIFAGAIVGSTGAAATATLRK